MAHDPARAKSLPLPERRKAMQQQCREEPCSNVRKQLFPVCVVCVHEGAVTRYLTKEPK